MAKQHQQQQRSLAQKSRESEDRFREEGLTSGRKLLLTVMVVVPAVLAFFYATGIWDVHIVDGRVIRDNVDDIVSAIAIADAFFAVIIINTFL